MRRIFCVGRNYAEHAKEFGNDERDPPFFFTKQADAIVASGAALTYPGLTQDLHHEAELAVAIGTGGGISSPRTLHPISSALHTAMIKPATICKLLRNLSAALGICPKVFDESAVINAIIPGRSISPDAAIRCRVDGRLRQNAKLET